MENQKQPWYQKTWLVIFLCFFFAPVGLYGLWKNTSIWKGWKIGVSVFLLIIIISAIAGGNKSETNAQSESTEANNQPKQIGIGEILHTDYFDVTINNVTVTDHIETGNQFADKKPDNQNYYIVMNTTFKNIDRESRMVTQGELYINYNNQEYKFDNPEQILADGYGLFLDQVNPLASLTSNLVYKIPLEVNGPVYYHPGRADDDERIFITDLSKLVNQK